MNDGDGVDSLPLCVVGPGGEFRSTWVPAKDVNDSKKERISKDKDNIPTRLGWYIYSLAHAFSMEILLYFRGVVGFVKWMVDPENFQNETIWPVVKGESKKQTIVKNKNTRKKNTRVCKKTDYLIKAPEVADGNHPLLERAWGDPKRVQSNIYNDAITKFDSVCKLISDRNNQNTHPWSKEPDNWPIVALGPVGMQQNKENHHVRSDTSSIDSQTTENPYPHSRLSTQKWLFPDYAGTGRRAKSNKGNRIRTRRRSGKERTVEAIEAQGTFFGTYWAGGVPG
jgi:hypothetical protein